MSLGRLSNKMSSSNADSLISIALWHGAMALDAEQLHVSPLGGDIMAVSWASPSGQIAHVQNPGKWLSRGRRDFPCAFNVAQSHRDYDDGDDGDDEDDEDDDGDDEDDDGDDGDDEDDDGDDGDDDGDDEDDGDG
eukprot:s1607_g1.t1